MQNVHCRNNNKKFDCTIIEKTRKNEKREPIHFQMSLAKWQETHIFPPCACLFSHAYPRQKRKHHTSPKKKKKKQKQQQHFLIPSLKQKKAESKSCHRHADFVSGLPCDFTMLASLILYKTKKNDGLFHVQLLHQIRECIDNYACTQINS